MGKSNAAKKKKAAAARALQSQQKCQPPAEPKVSNPVQPQLVNGHGNGVEVAEKPVSTTAPSARILHPPGKATSTSHQHQGSNVPVSKQKLTLPAGFESTDTAISSYYDYNHDSLIRSSSFNKAHVKGGASKGVVSRGARDAGVGFGWTSKVISSAVERTPELRVLENGYDLEKELQPWCCFGSNKWNGRRFAHGLSTNFSSPAIGSHKGGMWGTVDFVSDWANIKALIKSNYNENHLSYFVNRVGNSVTIDEFDLSGFMLFPDFLQLPQGFRKFVSEVLAEKETKKKLKEEIDKGKSNQSVLRKEAYHQLLHKSMKRPMVLKKPRCVPQAPCKESFLQLAILSTDKYKILVGSDIPTFVQSPQESDNENVSVSVSSSSEEKSCPTDALDLWLDNMLMQCPKTLLTQLKDTVVKKTEWIQTDDLPKTGKFDMAGCAEHTDNVLSFIHENVKPGESYWLYRAPGTVEMKMYNISKISLNEKNGPSSRIFENWTLLAPYAPFFDTTSLTKYSEFISELIPDKLKSDWALLDLNGLIDKNGTKVHDNKTGNKSQQKLGHKLENHVNLLESRLTNNCGWLIRNMEDINISRFKLILECLKGLYEHAMKATPCLADQLRRHAVERFLLLSLKLKKLMLEKTEQAHTLEIGKLKDDLKQKIHIMNSGICDILACLKEWYDEVDVAIQEPDSSKRMDWEHVGCRLHILYADTLSVVSDVSLESPNRSLMRRLDQNLPLDTELEVAVKSLNRASKLIPEAEDFNVKHPLMLPCMHVTEKADVPHKNALLNEVTQKISVALIKLVSHKLTFPAYLYHEFDVSACEAAVTASHDGHSMPSSSDTSSSDGVSLSVIRKTYEDIALLLDQCIHYGEQVKDTTVTEFDVIKPLWRANGLKKQIAETIFSLDNCRAYEFPNYDYLLVPDSDDILFRRKNRGPVDFSKLHTFSRYEIGNERKILPGVEFVNENKMPPPPGIGPSMRDRQAIGKVYEAFARATENVIGNVGEKIRRRINRDDCA